MEVSLSAARSGAGLNAAGGTHEDGTWLERLRSGDRQAFSDLVESYGGMVFELVFRTVRDRELAEDLTQDVFIRAYRALSGFKGKSGVSTWLYRIAYNVSMSEMEKSRYRYETAPPEAYPPAEGGGFDPHSGGEDLLDRIDRSETIERVGRLIGELAPGQAWAMRLYYMGEKTYQEISEIMDIPVGTVKTLLFRAKGELRRRLRDEGIQ
jgi:RNA polymerase sigma-70 factor (ECF subfamily)